jgi:hypothetical protein
VTLARVTRWSLIITPILAGIALLIFGTAGGISVGFGITLIGIGPIVWMWNWLLRMAFDEEAEKQAASERARAERAQSAVTEQPPPGEPPTDIEHQRPPAGLHEHPAPHAPREHPRPTRRDPRRRGSRRRPQ